ncbi:HIT domain protein [Mycoplasma haemocanis str. Illinois]|uniref:HIT domain protein n=1 Tax=Mycoplasma haemocanis (strain Illinois) TaxID=1111676 RepID=H6N7V8_MYCHN|nr:HIT domain-containing protein [Mycoplasma haemocanis]AEW45730.1 HIT domain protein [Mycoplasma haemocanis str. Illinois]
MCSQGSCVFCDISKDLPNSKSIMESEHAFALPDHKPITKGHTLIITKKHFENFMEVEDDHIKDVSILAKKTVKKLMELYPDIQGVNYVSNQGAKAKQVVFHFHLHIIPRY